MRTMTLRNSLLFAALLPSALGDACATRHWNEGENAFWACMGQWARDSDAIYILPHIGAAADADPVFITALIEESNFCTCLEPLQTVDDCDPDHHLASAHRVLEPWCRLSAGAQPLQCERLSRFRP